MPTQVPSLSDIASLQTRLDRLNERVEELELAMSRKCEHQEIVAMIEYALSKGVQPK